ncbi:PQQ-binding-like beta-propeller repeat protein, partial [Escherichia coli]
MQLRKTLLVGLVSAALLSGCSLFNSEEDVVTMSPLPKVENQFTPSKAWSTSVGDGIGEYYSHLRPAYQDSTIYAADRFGIVKAMDADSAIAWQTKVAGEAISRPVVSDGMVLVHTSNGMLQALNEADGAVKWTVNLDMPSLSLRGESAPAVAFGAAIVGGDNGRVSAVLMQQGQIIWQQRISQPSGATEIDRLNDVDTTPVIVDGVVYALGYNGNLTALDLRSGQIIWKRELGSVNDFIVDAGRIYLIDQNDRVVALSTEGGVTVWTQSDLLHRNLTPPVMYNG